MTRSVAQPSSEQQLPRSDSSTNMPGQLPSLEPDVVVETLLIMDYADKGSLDKHIQNACFRNDMVGL